jgi:hypothetical protein
MVASIPGVANRDARAVLDARVAAVREALAAGADDRVADELASIHQLRLWRGRNLTGFAAFAEDVLGLPPDRVGALSGGFPAESPSEEAVAVAVRVEAALLVAGVPGRVRLRGSRGEETLSIEIVADRAPAAFQEVARALHPLLRDLDRFRR